MHVAVVSILKPLKAHNIMTETKYKRTKMLAILQKKNIIILKNRNTINSKQNKKKKHITFQNAHHLCSSQLPIKMTTNVITASTIITTIEKASPSSSNTLYDSPRCNILHTSQGNPKPRKLLNTLLPIALQYAQSPNPSLANTTLLQRAGYDDAHAATVKPSTTDDI